MPGRPGVPYPDPPDFRQSRQYSRIPRSKMRGFRLHANTGVAGDGQFRPGAYQTEFERDFLSGFLYTGRRTQRLH